MTLPSTHRRPLIALCAALAAAAITGVADDTRTHGRLQGRHGLLTPSVRTGYAIPSAPADTLRLPPRDSVSLSGYDKPLRATRETLLLTNSSSRPLGSVALTITYTDLQGRHLHTRTDTLAASVPPGQTRLVSLRSWDVQQSYWYHLGQQPRTLRVTPYAVSCTVDFITVPSL